MGKKWWKKATGLSNAQRQASRKMGVRLSKTGCVMWLILPAAIGLFAVATAQPKRSPVIVPAESELPDATKKQALAAFEDMKANRLKKLESEIGDLKAKAAATGDGNEERRFRRLAKSLEDELAEVKKNPLAEGESLPLLLSSMRSGKVAAFPETLGVVTSVEQDSVRLTKSLASEFVADNGQVFRRVADRKVMIRGISPKGLKVGDKIRLDGAYMVSDEVMPKVDMVLIRVPTGNRPVAKPE